VCVGDAFIEFFQRLRSAFVIADLCELDAELVDGRLDFVEVASSLDDDFFRVVR